MRAAGAPAVPIAVLLRALAVGLVFADTSIRHAGSPRDVRRAGYVDPWCLARRDPPTTRRRRRGRVPAIVPLARRGRPAPIAAAGLAPFAATSVGAGLADSLVPLVACGEAQGLGAALLFGGRRPVARSALTGVCSCRPRGRRLAGTVGAAVGPAPRRRADRAVRLAGDLPRPGARRRARVRRGARPGESPGGGRGTPARHHRREPTGRARARVHLRRPRRRALSRRDHGGHGLRTRPARRRDRRAASSRSPPSPGVRSRRGCRRPSARRPGRPSWCSACSASRSSPSAEIAWAVGALVVCGIGSGLAAPLLSGASVADMHVLVGLWNDLGRGPRRRARRSVSS